MNEKSKELWKGFYLFWLAFCFCGIAFIIGYCRGTASTTDNQPTPEPAGQIITDLESTIEEQLGRIAVLETEVDRLNKLEQRTKRELRATLAIIAERNAADEKADRLEQAESNLIRDIYTRVSQNEGNYRTAETIIDRLIENNQAIRAAIDSR